MIVFYTMHSESPNIRKISIMLEEIGLPYTVKCVEKQNGGKFSDDFIAINPNATVPAIVDTDNGTTLLSPVQSCITLRKKPENCCQLTLLIELKL
ncbi:glutathione S-transferase [Sulfuriferula multivorans]|uniref:Glutathione S-transferase n=1 Tax=Sulfuriferula multivorans TaxID=1559896 RepID=A0A401JH01_9PROT|nr:glutathione S-transferase N-terminal domain-containing protein [Sulfuriferula multivorans]GBL46888.1 glutathione S-transferase [Sulfuriferula multivorans]